MNTIRELKQQEKYDNMLKRKNKEKNIYKSKNSTLRIEKMNLIKAVERKGKEIERLKNIIDKLEIEIEIGTGKYAYDTDYTRGLSDAFIYMNDRLKELKGVDKE